MIPGIRLPSARRALVIALALAALHAILVWGYAGIPWGDHAATLHALERYAAGQAPYRDFAWPHLPLALWVFGALARISGAGLAAVNVACTLLFFALVVAYAAYVRQLKPEVLLATLLGGLVLAFAYAAAEGVPLPFGTVDLSIPLGCALLLGAATNTLVLREHPALPRAIAVAVLAGLCSLTAPTFWPGALYLVGAAVLSLRRSSLPDRGRLTGVILGAFAGIVLLGAIGILAQSGWHGLGSAFTQSGRLGEELAGALPSWERFDVEVFVSGAVMLMGVGSLWLCLAIREGRAAQWGGALLLVALAAGAVHLGMSIDIAQHLQAYRAPALPTPIQAELALYLSSGNSLMGSALAVLNHGAERHIIPALLPVLMFLLVLTRGRRWDEPELRHKVLFLLGFCIVGRLWTGLGGVAWYQILIEMPIYALCVQFGAGAWGPRAGRAVLTALSLAMIVGAVEYFDQGRGPLTRRGPEPAIATARGTAHWPEFAVHQIRAARAVLDSRDPGRLRPLLAFGGASGWNYYLGRPSPNADDVRALEVSAATSVAARARTSRPPMYLLDFPATALVAPDPGVWLWQWEPVMRAGPAERRERPRFDRLVAQCARLVLGDSGHLAVRLYDCARPGGGPQATR